MLVSVPLLLWPAPSVGFHALRHQVEDCPVQDYHYPDLDSYPEWQITPSICKCGELQCKANQLCWRNQRNWKYSCKTPRNESALTWSTAIAPALRLEFEEARGGLIPVLIDVMNKHIPCITDMCSPRPLLEFSAVERSNCFAQLTACGRAAEFFENLYASMIDGIQSMKIDLDSTMAQRRLGNAAYDKRFISDCMATIDDLDPWVAQRSLGRRGTVTIENKLWDHIFLIEFTKSGQCFLYQAWTGQWTALSWVGVHWPIPSVEDVPQEQQSAVRRLRQTNLHIEEDSAYEQVRNKYGMGKAFDCPSSGHASIKRFIQMTEQIRNIGLVPTPGERTWPENWDSTCQFHMRLQAYA